MEDYQRLGDLGGQCIKFHLLGDKVRDLDGSSKIDVTMCIALGLEL